MRSGRIKNEALTSSEIGRALFANRDREAKSCKHLGGKTGEVFPPSAGLGDKLAARLKAIGITPKSYQAAKEKMGLKKGCGCSARQKCLNYMGKLFGFSRGQGAELQAIIAVDNLQTSNVYACEVLGECLPHLIASPKATEQVKAMGYNACKSCDHRCDV